jgi:hypothetical protein
MSPPLHYLVVLSIAVQCASAWSPLACPAPDAPFPASCTAAPLSVDAAVTMFFQIESQGSDGGWLNCTSTGSDPVTYCARSWTQPESGSVGSCFFLLPAHESYSCKSSGSLGNINSIDADFTPLANGVLASSAPRRLSCPSGTLSGSCTEPAASTDSWVYIAWVGETPSAVNTFTCSAGGAVICSSSTAATGGSDVSSCSALVPAGSPLTCTVTAGSVAFRPSFALAFALSPYGTSDREKTPPCPVAGPAPNDCDCEFQSPANATDTIVVLSASSPDAGFNSFHCYYGGVNVCGWGSNTNMNYSVSGPWF